MGILAFPVEEFRAILARERDFPRDFFQELYDLSDVVIVFAEPRTWRWIEEIVSSGDKLEYLETM